MYDRIGFSARKGWLHRLIRWISGSNIQRTWLLYFDLDLNREMVREGTLMGIRIVPYDAFIRRHDVIKMVAPPVSLRAGMTRFGELLERRAFKRPWERLLCYWQRLRRGRLNHATSGAEMVAHVLQWSGHPGTDYWLPEEMGVRDIFGFIVDYEAKTARQAEY